MIRIANDADSEFLFKHDRHISKERMKHRIQEGRIFIYHADDSPMGWLRYSYMLGIIPFMEMLFILENHRGKGFGHRLLKKWESEMFQLGTDFVLTSTQADQEAQHFYRKMGYKDCGALFLPTQLPAELFLLKTNLNAE